jgi:predicted phage gp36 major capsid-like protein
MDDESADIYAEAFQIFVQNGMLDLDPSPPHGPARRLHEAGPQGDPRAGGIGTGSAGGYLVPQGFRQQIIEKMKAYGAVQQVATVLNTNTGAPLPWPTNDDTGNVGALLAENTAASEQDFTLGTAQLGAYKYTSKLVRVSLEFLQDVDWLDVEGFPAQVRRAARPDPQPALHDRHRLLAAAGHRDRRDLRRDRGGVAAITADELIDLQHSVDPAYRNERSKFMLSDTALKGIRKLKAAGTGEYLFQSRRPATCPNLLAGSPYVVNQDMAVPATGVKSVLYGDFEAGYVIRLVKAFELIRLDERYAEFGQVGFIGFDRADGLVQDASAYKALTQA